MRLPVGASQYTNVVLAQDSLLQGATSPSIPLQVLNSVTEQFVYTLCANMAARYSVCVC
jgi:hypothetical protein